MVNQGVVNDAIKRAANRERKRKSFVSGAGYMFFLSFFSLYTYLGVREDVKWAYNLLVAVSFVQVLFSLYLLLTVVLFYFSDLPSGIDEDILISIVDKEPSFLGRVKNAFHTLFYISLAVLIVIYGYFAVACYFILSLLINYFTDYLINFTAESELNLRIRKLIKEKKDIIDKEIALKEREGDESKFPWET